MKIKPEILLGSNQEIDYKKILVTGLDESFIAYVRDFILDSFKRRNYFIDASGEYNSGLVGGLFSDRKVLFLLSNFSVKDQSDKFNDDQNIMIASSNGKKTNLIKASFLKQKDALVVECYALDRKSKEQNLKKFLEKNNLRLSQDVYWYIIDNFDNSFPIFVSQLKTLCLFSKNINLISDVEKITFVKNKLELNKIFFSVFKQNIFLINSFNKSINSLSDFYIFLNSTKSYIGLISEFPNKEAALTKFPRYLFAEKDIFLKIHNQLNTKKLLRIFKTINKAELMTRKHSDLYSVIGLRFFLNLKKIIVS